MLVLLLAALVGGPVGLAAGRQQPARRGLIPRIGAVLAVALI